MAAGPTPAEIVTARRRAIKHLTEVLGTEGIWFDWPKAKSISGRGWEAILELQRASNGEACLIWYLWTGGRHILTTLDIPQLADTIKGVDSAAKV